MKIIKSLSINVSVFFAVWLGLSSQNEGINSLTVLACFAWPTIVWILCGLCMIAKGAKLDLASKEQAKNKPSARTLPAWLSFCCDAAFAVMLASFGHHYCGFFWLLQQIPEAVIASLYNECADKQNAKT